MKKQKVAVFFGGRSPEHDVSIVSGLQVLDAIDGTLYEPFPVYVTTKGEWYVGKHLRDRNSYFKPGQLSALTRVNLDISPGGDGLLIPVKSSWLKTPSPIPFDIALPIFHGLSGEDGGFQGMMEFANIPYAGMRAQACSIFMDKDATKKALKGLGVAQLPCAVIMRPSEGLLVSEETLKALIEPIGYPCCVKPANLGSSIGVGKADTLEEARLILADIFKHDFKAIIEPFLSQRVEYNVSVRMGPEGVPQTSAIERPKSSEELLNFKEKYLNGGGGKKGVKMGSKSGSASQGMLSLTRDINPDLISGVEDKIQTWAKVVYTCFDPGGAPRIDFMVDRKTDQVWFNELNPIPGSYGYYLWEASSHHVLFTDFLTDLLKEASQLHGLKQIPQDPVPQDARLFKR